MPMNWDTADEAKLFAAIYSVADVKLSSAQLSQIAKYMGPGKLKGTNLGYSQCTPKAITHRLAKIRKEASKLDGDAGDVDDEPKAKRARTTKPKGAKKKQITATDDEDDREGAAGMGLISPPSSGGKKRKQQQDGIEVGEDIGEGLRASGQVKKEAAVDDDDEGELV